MGDGVGMFKKTKIYVNLLVLLLVFLFNKVIE